MAIRIITGVPRAGKTYYAVKHLVDNYYVKSGEVYTLKEGVNVVTNIDGLKLPHTNLNKLLKAKGLTFDSFFTIPIQEEYTKDFKNIIYIIDEAQQFIRTRFANNDVFSYFEYHGHYGHDVYLITHSIDKVTKQITSLMEYEIRAVKRSFSIAGEFKYNIRSGYEIFKRQVIKPKQEIYDLYRSQFATEKEKIKNPIVKTVAIMAVALIICAIFAYKFLFTHTANAKYSDFDKTAKVISKQIEQKEIKTVQRKAIPEVITEAVRLNWANVNGKVWIVDPILDDLILLSQYNRYPVKVVFNKNSTLIYAMIPRIIEEPEKEIDKNSITQPIKRSELKSTSATIRPLESGRDRGGQE